MTRLNPTVSEHLVELDLCQGCTFIWFDPGELKELPRVPDRERHSRQYMEEVHSSARKRRDKIEDDLHPMSWRYPTDVWFQHRGRGNSSVEPALKTAPSNPRLERTARDLLRFGQTVVGAGRSTAGR